MCLRNGGLATLGSPERDARPAAGIAGRPAGAVPVACRVCVGEGSRGGVKCALGNKMATGLDRAKWRRAGGGASDCACAKWAGREGGAGVLCGAGVGAARRACAVAPPSPSPPPPCVCEGNRGRGSVSRRYRESSPAGGACGGSVSGLECLGGGLQNLPVSRRRVWLGPLCWRPAAGLGSHVPVCGSASPGKALGPEPAYRVLLCNTRH